MSDITEAAKEIISDGLNRSDSEVVETVRSLLAELDKHREALEFYADSEQLARLFHDAYEIAAKVQNWETQESCRVTFDDLPKANQMTMSKTCEIVGKRAREVLGMSETNTDYKQWALDMCVLLDSIEQHCYHNDVIKRLCEKRFVLAEKHGVKVEYIGETTGLIQ